MNQTHKTEARWFIWTIVFLVVAGTLLVLYINYTSITFSSGNGSETIMLVHRTKQIVPPAQTSTSTKAAAKSTR